MPLAVGEELPPGPKISLSLRINGQEQDSLPSEIQLRFDAGAQGRPQGRGLYFQGAGSPEFLRATTIEDAGSFVARTWSAGSWYAFEAPGKEGLSSGTVEVLGYAADARQVEIELITRESASIAEGKFDQLISLSGGQRDLNLEQKIGAAHALLLAKAAEAGGEGRAEARDFIAYGTQAARVLGSGERAGVLWSFYRAYGALPSGPAGWSDALKIAKGRWPAARSKSAEEEARMDFRKFYGREPDSLSASDSSAVMIMAYGLLPPERSLLSESSAVKTFRSVSRRGPLDARDWNIVRAIAYSGAVR